MRRLLASSGRGYEYPISPKGNRNRQPTRPALLRMLALSIGLVRAPPRALPAAAAPAAATLLPKFA